MSALPRSQSVSVSRSRDRRRERGFTFIEILIVMGIISVLVGGVIVAMQIWNKKGPEFATTQVVAKAQSMVHAWKSKFETYPPTDVKNLPKFTGFGEPVKGSINRTNTGIEALVQALGYPGFKSDASWGDNELGNTDEDRLDKAIVTSGIPDLREIIDAWGNPLVYFHSADYASADSSPHIYRLGNEPSDFYAPGDEVEAAPHRDADGQFRNANTFQIYSMGPDGQPNTEDDMGNWTK